MFEFGLTFTFVEFILCLVSYLVFIEFFFYVYQACFLFTEFVFMFFEFIFYLYSLFQVIY